MTTRLIRHALDREQIVKKSRFVATAGPVGDETEARAFIEAHSDPSANHNCWAWRVGQTYRFNDAGEPSGTAGKPILQAIDGQAIDRVAVVVTRWFGGILLGSGGLMRAYGGTAAMCLRDAETIPFVETVSGTVVCNFSDAALVHARLSALAQVQTLDQTFLAEGVQMVLSVEKDAAATITRLVSDLTSGRAHIAWPDAGADPAMP
ncbi:YigZ family protein [Tianweitania sp. BSSL-BM11]|uniref:YigZ family protein n=1 Tax=Tianweitania aestuarii TaxID=2814886 RepID=A0ABS5RT79_9HYPH|nr:YigZ family protein [Tianweitania aestuarii]MBS9720255.1 YigZ family protein [Tianweitania aestuarii]